MRDSSVLTAVRSTARPRSAVRSDARRPIEVAARVVTGVWAAVGAINFAVWLMVSIISGSVDQPWFLWSVVAGGVVVLGLRGAARITSGAPDSDDL